MVEKENEVIARLSSIIDQILSGDCPEAIDLANIGISDNTALNELAEKISFLSEQCSSSYQFIINLSRGKLDENPPLRNSFANPYKQLHSELRYLTWQIQQIADGDYGQRVSFSGDFAEAINKMILALRERQVLADLLKESNQTKDKLFSIIAHDLKNPFNSLIGISELLLREIDSGDTDMIKEFAKVINDSASNGYALLINLLEWSRLQSGRIVFTPQRLQLKNVILGNIRLANASALSKNITVEYDEAEEFSVVSDNNILNTILRNILSNAIKYTSPDGMIQIFIKKESGFYYVTVKDNGVGIKEEDAQKLFHIETIQSTRGTRNEEGTGLGLILCKDFIQKIGGEIWVESVHGEGTTVTFSLPDTAGSN